MFETSAFNVSEILSCIFDEHTEFKNFRIYSDDASFFIDMDVPGFTRDDLEITVLNGILTISGKRSLRQGEIRTVKNSFTIDRNTYSDKIKAVVSNGILHIMIPRFVKQSSSEKRIEIK